MNENERDMYELEYPAPEVGEGSAHGPTLIVALQGYADAGQGVEASSEHLLAALESRLLASFNSDELIDYRSRRPAVTLEDNRLVDAEKIELGLRVVRDNDGKSFLLLSGPEPDLRWEGFTEAVADLAEKFGVAQTICLYAAPMAVPHTRPLVVSAHSNTADLQPNMFSFDSKIVIPGSASLMLERVLDSRGRKVAGYTAHVPHYLSSSPYPAATYELLDAVARVSNLNLPLRSLERDKARVSQQIEEQMSDSAEVRGVVAALENHFDEELERYREKHPQAILPGEQRVPTGEEIGQEFERFLATLDAHETAESNEDSVDTAETVDSERELPEDED